MSADQPLVTVLTPAYNADEHIEACLESVRSQTYTNWQYLVADNCSSDRTPEIVKSFAARDSRIEHVRFGEFVDVISSYNRAFSLVGPQSAYTKVVGADDTLFPQCLERMVDAAQVAPVAGIVSAYRLDGDEVGLKAIPEDVSMVPGHEVLRDHLLGGPNIIGSPTSVMFRSDFVRAHRPFYDPTFRHADTEAAYRVLAQSDLAFVHEVLTFTRRPPAGETTFAQRLNSYLPEDIRMLLRYGPLVMDEESARRRLRSLLKDYVWQQFKWRVKRSRRRDKTLRAFHQREIERMRVEGASRREVRWATAVAGFLVGPPV